MGETDFDSGWRFYLGDDEKAREAGFDDAKWRAVDLPHDWGVEGAFDRKWASCTAFLPGGIGWYRKRFVVPADAKGKVVRIRFDGVMNHSTVWCNGKEVGGRPYGYSSFTCDLTGVIRFGEPNVISVRVDHEKYADSRWYNGSGIYRNVWLTVSEPVHVAEDGVFVTTPVVGTDAATVRAATAVDTLLKLSGDVTVVSRALDQSGTEIAQLHTKSVMADGGRTMFIEEGRVPDPKLWSPEHPTMYSVVTEVMKGGKVIDRRRTPFGIRTFKFDPAKGFSINGESMKIKGVCVHGDAGALGVAVPLHVWEHRLKLLQEAGCNAIRCSHNPPAPEFLDLCDRMGFLVMDEAFDEWTEGKHKWIVGHNQGKPGTDGYHSDFEKWADTDIEDMVVRDRNHPSIVMWSIGNEIDYQNDPFPPNSPVLPPVAQRLIKDVKSVDTTRPVTAACAFPATNLFKQYLDIEGYNYMEKLYAGDHAAHPDRVIYGSENFHTLQAWQAVAENGYIAGQFLWTGVDYLGEAGEWPSHGSGAGLLNLAGFPKNMYYYRKSLWTDAPMVYLSAGGLGGRRGMQQATSEAISCFTNCDSVELFHDGQSLGTKTHAAGEILRWPMELTSGVVTAVGKKGDQTVTFELKEAGAPVRLQATADVSGLRGDGRDVAEVEVDVVDKDGTVVPEAGNAVHCAITGPGRIIGVENGNLNDTQRYGGTDRSVFQGRMRVYVQAMKGDGDVTLTLSAEGLNGTSVVLPVR
ncbi:MAG TPA: glycoside hydrolase family 2 TIM barrel-domain containing protein [Phycisphaerae bacterium]|nr:glycoside hydrolase family 2 TIM barrel-domain containing protein [Phycisphaerae bacterium]